MAQAYITVEFTIADADREMSTIGVALTSDVAVSSDDVLTFVQDIWLLIKPMITGALAGAAWRQGATGIPAVVDPANVPDVLSDVQEGAEFYWWTEDHDHKVHMKIPTFREELFVNGGAGKVVDVSHPAVAAFIAALTTGIPQDASGHYLRHSGRPGDLLTSMYKTPQQRFTWRKLKKKLGI